MSILSKWLKKKCKQAKKKIKKITLKKVAKSVAKAVGAVDDFLPSPLNKVGEAVESGLNKVAKAGKILDKFDVARETKADIKKIYAKEEKKSYRVMRKIERYKQKIMKYELKAKQRPHKAQRYGQRIQKYQMKISFLGGK